MLPGRIPDEAALLAALAAPAYLLFKHSARCPLSAKAFAAYRAFIEGRPGLATGWLDVVEQQPLARLATERTGVAHQSPQALWIRDGAVAWHASHWDITGETLAGAVAA